MIPPNSCPRFATENFNTIKNLLRQNKPVATLISYELPPLGVSFEYLQTFPVWGPLAVSIEINFGFTVDLHAVGFDTYGYMRYAKTGFDNPGLFKRA